MRFPKLHIASSVVNRILDLADQEMLTARESEAPAIPTDATQQGEALDQVLSQPVPAVPAPVGSQDEALLNMQQGGSAAEAVGGMALLESL